MTEAFIQGFIDKCAEAGVDPQEGYNMATSLPYKVDRGITPLPKPGLSAAMGASGAVSRAPQIPRQLRPFAAPRGNPQARQGKPQSIFDPGLITRSVPFVRKLIMEKSLPALAGQWLGKHTANW